jgi:hypothetical protein
LRFLCSERSLKVIFDTDLRHCNTEEVQYQ